jgi:HlyD family secretion protein
MPRTRPIQRLGVRGLAALSAAVLLWGIYQGLTWGLRDSEVGSQPDFDLVAVVRGDLAEQVIGTGVTKPLRFVVVQSEIPGVVTQVRVDDGDRVQRDDILVELDRDRLESHVAELRAALDMAQAHARYDVVGKGELDLAEAERNLERASRLAEQKVASPERLEQTERAVQRARIALSDARAEAAARRAAVARAEAALRLAEKNLEKSVIRAALDGVVVRREVEVGSAVTDLEHGGTVIAVLADDGSIHVLAEVDENDISKVRSGQPAEVRIDAFPNQEFAGRVRKVSWSGTSDGALANFEVEIELDPDPRFRVGMSADVRITVGEHRGVLLVPNNSILRRDGGPAVRRATNRGRSQEIVPVDAGYSDGFQTVIAEDSVAEGDRVLVMKRVR